MNDATQSIRLSQIHLDLFNPRHPPQPSERDAINRLIDHDDVKALAKHIAENGGTSPIELVALVPHAKIIDGYTAAEGNRRVCALKLLADPDKATKDVDRKYFRSLQAGMNAPITQVNAIVFADMTVARQWVELRHEGAQGGIGTKPWTPEQKTRFNQTGRDDSPNALALALLDYARNKGLLPATHLQSLPLTTLTRFLSTPEVRAALGLTHPRTLEINVPTAEFERAITHFLGEFGKDGSSVTSRADAAQRKRYAEDLRTTGVAPTTRNQAPHRPGIAPAAPVAAAAATLPPKAATVRNNRSPDKRKYVVPTSFSVRIRDKVLKRLFDELRALEVDHFSFSPVYVLRTLIEKSTTLYLQSKGLTPKAELHKKLTQLAEQLKSEGMKDRELKYLRTLASVEDNPASPDTLGHYVHGGAVPLRTYATRLWDNLEHVLKHVLAAV